MMALDMGSGLQSMFRQIATRARRGARLYVMAPFIEVDTDLWRSTLRIVRSGASVILFTRPTSDQLLLAGLQDFARLGGHTIYVQNIHAKAFLWIPGLLKGKVAFIGSHNFTRSSESWAFELGLLIWGDGWIENHLFCALERAIRELSSVHSQHRPDSLCARRTHR